MDATFKSAGKAMVIEKEGKQCKIAKGSLVTIINENSEILAWVSHCTHIVKLYRANTLFSNYVRRSPLSR